MRVEFKSMAQADFYVTVCELILKSHVIQPDELRMPRQRTSFRTCRDGGYAHHPDLVCDVNVEEIAKAWVHHGDEILDPAFTKGFELAKGIVSEQGFDCDCPTSMLVRQAVEQVRRVECLIRESVKWSLRQ